MTIWPTVSTIGITPFGLIDVSRHFDFVLPMEDVLLNYNKVDL